MANILVIDDTGNIRKMVALTLSKSGHKVQTAENGNDGLQLFAAGTAWDLILVDQQMPELSGDEFVTQARRRDPMARIIMMTAFATPELASQVIEHGAFDFLRKPFTVEVLRSAVEVALSYPRHATADSAFDSHATRPLPGQSGFVIPRISWRMNGFSFWPLDDLQGGGHPKGFELGRLFQVRSPAEEFSACFVGVTPHIRAQIETQMQHPIADDDSFWNKVCGQTLLNFLAEKAQMPPDVLPVYDVPKSSQSSRGLVSWGAFFGR